MFRRLFKAVPGLEYGKKHQKDFNYFSKSLLTYDLSFHYCFSLRSLCLIFRSNLRHFSHYHFDAIALASMRDFLTVQRLNSILTLLKSLIANGSSSR